MPPPGAGNGAGARMLPGRTAAGRMNGPAARNLRESSAARGAVKPAAFRKSFRISAGRDAAEAARRPEVDRIHATTRLFLCGRGGSSSLCVVSQGVAGASACRLWCRGSGVGSGCRLRCRGSSVGSGCRGRMQRPLVRPCRLLRLGERPEAVAAERLVGVLRPEHHLLVVGR